MTLETANPVIVCLILLPFVVCCLALVAGVLNHRWKHRPEPIEPIHGPVRLIQTGVPKLTEDSITWSGTLSFEEEEDEEP